MKLAVGLVLIAISAVAAGIIGSELELPPWVTGILGGLASLGSVTFLLPMLVV